MDVLLAVLVVAALLIGVFFLWKRSPYISVGEAATSAATLSPTLPTSPLPVLAPTKVQVGWVICMLVVFALAPVFVRILPDFFGPTWEYKVVAIDDDDKTELPNLGIRGWEIVSARRVTKGSRTEFAYEYVLKRPRYLWAK